MQVAVPPQPVVLAAVISRIAVAVTTVVLVAVVPVVAILSVTVVCADAGAAPQIANLTKGVTAAMFADVEVAPLLALAAKCAGSTLTALVLAFSSRQHSGRTRDAPT